jgi:prolyl-tRNA synthetase
MEKTEAPSIPWPYTHEPELPLQKAHFATPGILAMEEQAKAFKDENVDGLPLDHASKFYLYRATKGESAWDVGLVIRSDHEPNLVKFRNLLKADSIELVPMDEAEKASGAKSGFIGPVELNVPMYADGSLGGGYNLTCGANRTDFHHFGFRPDRDLAQSKGFHDLRMALEGDACPRCGRGRFQAFRGIEVGQVFKLGTKYSTSMGCTYLDAEGKEFPMVMGCYGLGVTRTISAVIEQNHDADGIIWPWAVAPYHVHLLCLDAGDPAILAVAERLEKALESSGIEVLHDDRDGLSPGVKFKDADLLGFPLRAVVGARGLKDGHVELRDRRTKETLKMKPDELVGAVLDLRGRMMGGPEAVK